MGPKSVEIKNEATDEENSFEKDSEETSYTGKPKPEELIDVEFLVQEFTCLIERDVAANKINQLSNLTETGLNELNQQILQARNELEAAENRAEAAAERARQKELPKIEAQRLKVEEYERQRDEILRLQRQHRAQLNEAQIQHDARLNAVQVQLNATQGQLNATQTQLNAAQMQLNAARMLHDVELNDVRQQITTLKGEVQALRTEMEVLKAAFFR